MGNNFDATKNRKLYGVLTDAYQLWQKARDGAEATDCIEMVCDRHNVSLTKYDENRNYAPIIQEILDEANKLKKVAFECRFEAEGQALSGMEDSLIDRIVFDDDGLSGYFDTAKSDTE